MTPAETIDALRFQVATLESDNRKLRKINGALITRVEAGSSNEYDPYATFEHSVHLAQQVREKTEALNDTLATLEKTNSALSAANKQSELFKQRFIDAIESINDAFVLLDDERRIVLQNSHFDTFWRNSNLPIEQGVNLKDLKELAKVRGVIKQAYPGDGGSSPVYQLNDGRWFQLSEKRTLEGGWVMLYTDITALKEAESERLDYAIEQKSTLLQNLVDNISQGVLLISSNGQIEVWNKRFSQLSKLSETSLRSSPYYHTLKGLTELDLESKSSNDNDHYIQTLKSGTVLEIRDNLLVSGQRIKTFTDVTKRHQYAESIKHRENWLRLITDNVPAMIAYIGQDLCFQFTNKVYEDWYQLVGGSLNGVSLEQSRINGDYHKLKPFVEQALAGESISFEIEETDINGQRTYLLKSYVPNKDHNGVTLGFFVLVRNVTARRNSALALQHAHDELELRVHQRTSELSNVNDKLLREVKDRRRAQTNLINAKREAQRANISKTKFLAAVSHDLLQPLNAAQLFTSSVADTTESSQSKKLIGSIANSLTDLESLICTLVDISKLDAGVVKADKAPFKLGELLHNLHLEYQQLAPQFGVTLRAVATNLVVNSDSVLLARILRNFISNAFRYTDKGKVLIGCRRQGNKVIIEVWDNGVGMSDDELAVIFQEFRRLKGSGKAFGNGLGLGLAIVDKLSTVLNHEINVSSCKGKGSVFSVTVPIGLLVIPPLDTKQLVAHHNTGSLNGRVVWVVDNDMAICQGMATLLASWGCVISTATDLTSLTNAVNIKTDHVDLIILDYHLDNGATGLDVAAVVHQQRNDRIPTLMITANYSQNLKNQMKKKDILLLNKPVKPMKLKTSMLFLMANA